MKHNLQLLLILVLFPSSLYGATALQPSTEYASKGKHIGANNTWEFDEIKISVHRQCFCISCDIDDFDSMPYTKCYSGYITAFYDKESGDRPSIKITFEGKTYDTGYFSGDKIFKVLYRYENPEIIIERLNGTKHVVVLSSFKSTIREYFKVQDSYNKAEETKAIILRGLIIISVLVFFFISIIYIRKVIKKATPVVRNTIKNTALKTQETFENRRVNRIIKDETIRQTIREQVSVSNADEIQVLKNQIKTAIDSGDTETATKLMKVLDRFK